MQFTRYLKFAVLCALAGAASTFGGGGDAGAATAPWASVSPSSLNFGSVSMGSSSAAQVVTVSNSGTATLTVSSVSVDNAAYSVSAPGLPVSLAPSQSWQMQVMFKPSAASAVSGWLSIASNTTNSPNSIALSGSGVSSPPQISVGPAALSFGSQSIGTVSAAQALTVTNTGAVNATVSAISVDNANFAASLPALPVTLAPSQSIRASLTFKPASAGSFSGWVSVYSNAQYSPNSVVVSGTGAAAPSSGGPANISVGPSSLSFGNQSIGSASAARTLTVTNTGGVNATVSAISCDNSNFIVSAPVFPATLAPSQSFQATLAFRPASAGSFSGWVSVYSNSQYSPNSIAVTGSGVNSGNSTGSPALGVSPSSLSFGTQTVGAATSAQTLTLTNTGSGSLSVSGLSASPSQFAIVVTPALPLTLAAGQSANVGVVFTPTSAGIAMGSVTVNTNASPATSSVSLSGTGKSAGSGGPSSGTGLTLRTTSLHTGFVQQAYSASLTVAGGAGPYLWSVNAGALPPGLALNASTGQITGSPTQDGVFSVGIQVTDSTKPTALGGNGTFNVTVAPGVYDQYGGITEQACSNGPAAHFYTQKIYNRWWLCTPAGNAFWLRGVYHVDNNDSGADYQGVTLQGSACTSSSPASPSNPCSVIVQKYGDAGPTWGPQTVQKLKSLGFNTTAEFSSAYVQPTMTTSAWTSTPDKSNPQKMPFVGLVWPSHYARSSNSYANPLKDLVGPLNSSVYNGIRHAMFDVFDPNFAKWLAGDLGDYTKTEYSWLHSSHTDYLIGLNFDDTDELFGFGAGVDFEALDNGNLVTGMAHAHLGWVVLCTPPTQYSGTDANGSSVSYADSTVYSKQAFSSFMSNRYDGNIALLNAAWGSSYSTFGSNGGWGSGSGLMDENGTHAWVPKDPYGLKGATGSMQTDLNAFLLYFAQQYFSTIKAALHNAAPGVLYLGPTNLGGWGAPARAQILQAAAPYVDVIPISSIPTGCLSCSDDQSRIDFLAANGGDKPWINWEGFLAQPDSYMSPFGSTDTSFPQTSSQSAKGSLFQTMISAQLSAKDSSSGTYHIVGYKWWQYYDDRGEESNWGLFTRRDNGYDGTAALVGGGMDSWGYPTGGEQSNYGNLLDDVTGANLNVYKTLLGLP